MAKFFRRIRQQLLSQNSFARYIAYAIGEIFLVVVGILIALQVNNSNEQRKSDAQGRNYLISMKSELLNNLEVVTTEIETLDRSMSGQRELISLMNTEKDTAKEVDLSRIFAVSFSNVHELRYQDGTFKELLYSGGLTSIDNDSIRNEVTSWEGRMIAIRKQEQGVYEVREKIIDYMIDNGAFKNMLDDVGASGHFQIMNSIRRNSSKVLLTSQRFENLVSYHIALNDSQKFYYQRLENDIKNLLSMVERDLNK